MSEILQGVLRMPPDCWGDDSLDIAQRHGIYVEAADRIEELEELNRILLKALKAANKRWERWNDIPWEAIDQNVAVLETLMDVHAALHLDGPLACLRSIQALREEA